MQTVQDGERKVVIIGAGPAGLTAAAELCDHGITATIVEADAVVGGLARTVNYKGYLFDIGGHRFFTKWPEIERFWFRVLGDQFVERRRLSRIYYRSRFFNYPLRPLNALLGLGLWETLRILCDYVRSRLFPHREEKNVEQWISNRFGRRLYEVFFKTYTEKVWGVPCTEIDSEWAAQRIKGLSLASAVKNALLPSSSDHPKTLVDHFHYPERGPGQMWESLAGQLKVRGCHIHMQSPVLRICHSNGGVKHLETHGSEGKKQHEGTHFISSMPIREVVQALDPPAPESIQLAAERLRYRDFLIVSLILNRPDVMPDNWIYIHDPGVRLGRIQNFKNWSPSMVPDQGKTCLGLEYFVFQDDDLWSMPDDDLIELARRELIYLKLARAEDIEDGTVVRMKKAYPMYDPGWWDQVRLIRDYLQSACPNLQLVGRNGMHKYNNQDHSMMTALCAARNILGANYDLWAINTEPEYQEEISKSSSAEPIRPSYAEPRRIPKRQNVPAISGSEI